MSSPNKVPVSTWNVTSTIRQPDPNSPGSGQWVYEVSFTTGAGANGSVYIPEAQIGDLIQVRSKIAALAQQLDALRTLTHEGP